MGQTSNPTLRYPDGTDRPRATQIRNLAEDAHAAFLADRARLDTIESGSETPITSIGPGFTALSGWPRVYRSGAWRRAEGVFSWDIGGMPGARRVATIDAEDRPWRLRLCGGSYFYRAGYAAIPVGLHVQDANGGEIRIPGNEHLGATALAAGTGWYLNLSITWKV